MNRKTFSGRALNKEKVLPFSTLILLLLLSTSSFVGIVAGHSVPTSTEHTLVIASIWGPASIDPHWAYDEQSMEVVFNIYDRLINFKVNRTESNPTYQGKTDQFVPALATEWVENAPPHSTAPEYTNNTWYFKIREGIPWHNTSFVTPTPPSQDVEYSFERWMVVSHGSQWKIYEPLLNMSGPDWSNPNMPSMIDDAVESNSTHVWFNLAIAYSSMAFKQTLAQSWASVMPNEWAYQHGCWPGEAHPEENPYTIATMTQYYNPPVSPLDDYPPGTGGRVECGCGPYNLTSWDAVGHTYTLTWFPSYWGGWPCPSCNQYGYQGQCGYAEGWIKTVNFKGIDDWGIRKSMFLAGDCDFCYVPRQNLPEMVTNWDENPTWEEEEYRTGIDCYPGIPKPELEAMVFNFNITISPLLGDPPYDEIHETGFPYWGFNDTHSGQAGNGTILRHAFAYSFNYTSYIENAYLGEAKQPPNPNIEGAPYYEYLWDVDSEGKPAYANGVPDCTVPGADLCPPDTPDPTLPGGDPWSQPDYPNGTNGIAPNRMHYHDPYKAEELFKAAWDGDIWANGFTFTILYNEGNTAREVAARMLEENVEALNPLFHINVEAVDWSTYLQFMIEGKLVIFFIDWRPSFLDPHAMFMPFMHSAGAIAEYQSYSNSEADALIEQGGEEPDENKRIDIYHRLGEIYFQDCPSVPLVQPNGRHWERDWMEGWYFNPLYPQTVPWDGGHYYYHLWKGYTGDCNRDYVVNLFDLTIIGTAWDSRPGDPGWNPCADLNDNGHVFLYDLTIVGDEYD